MTFLLAQIIEFNHTTASVYSLSQLHMVKLPQWLQAFRLLKICHNWFPEQPIVISLLRFIESLYLADTISVTFLKWICTIVKWLYTLFERKDKTWSSHLIHGKSIVLSTCWTSHDRGLNRYTPGNVPDLQNL